MKRILLFVLLFGSGLAILFNLQGGVSPTPGWEGAAPEPSVDNEKLIPIPSELGNQGETENAEPEPAEIPEEDQPGIRVEISKRIRAEFFPPEDGKAIGELNVEDSRTNAEGSIELFGIVVTYFGKGELTAKTGLASLEREPGSIVPKISWDLVRLSAVEMDLEAGHPLAPMTLSGAELHGNLPALIFDLSGSPSGADEKMRPKVVAPRFDFEAATIHANGQDQILRIDGKALGRVRNDAGEELYRLSGDTIELVGTGAADLDSKVDAIPFRLRITGSAQLTLVGDQLATLSSNELTLLGKRTPDGELVLSDVRVDGTGVLAFGASTFTGSSFTFDFDKAGETGSFVVDGKPHVVFDLSQVQESSDIEDTQPLVLDCEGPLTVALDSFATFLTRTPTTLTWEQTTLTSQGGFVGSLSETQDSVSLQAVGGVVLDSVTAGGELLFRTESLLFDYADQADTPREILISSEGAANFQVDGAGVNDGVFVRGTSARSLTLEMHGDLWSIPEAHDIDFTLTDKFGEMRATARDLTGFDPIAKSLDARGDVHISFSGARGTGSGTGETVVMHGLDSVRIEGAEGEPAVFKFNGAVIRAETIFREGELLRAQERVSAELPLEGGACRFECDTLRVSGLPEQGELVDGTSSLSKEQRAKLLSRDLSFAAIGNVIGTATLGGESLALDCGSLTVDQVLNELDLREVVLAAHSVNSATWETADKIWDAKTEKWDARERLWTLQCGTIRATAREQPITKENADATDEQRSHFSLLAEGGVSVREKFTGFFGRGEFLNLERGDTNRVRLDGGPKGATVSGMLPGSSSESEARYKGRVLWMEATDEKLVAANVDIEVTGLSFMKANKAVPLTIKCDHLEGVPGTLQLDGEVSIYGSTQDTPNILLTAEHATFTDKLFESDATASGATAFDVSFLAHGQVRLRQGFLFELFGTDLIVEQGGRRLRVAGRPASITHSGFCFTSAWIEFDTERFAFESGKGEVCMDPKVAKFLKKVEERDTAQEDKP